MSQSLVWRGVLLCLALGWLYFDVLRRLTSDWYHDENYSHGLLVPFIAAYALWQNREELQATALRPLTWLGAALMAGAVSERQWLATSNGYCTPATLTVPWPPGW